MKFAGVQALQIFAGPRAQGPGAQSARLFHLRPLAARCAAVRAPDRRLDRRLGAHAASILSHPRYRLHVITSRGRHIMRREGRLSTPLGYFGAFATNLISRRAMGGWLERAMFSDPREALPFALHDYRTRQVTLGAGNLARCILASCSIPFWLDKALKHRHAASARLSNVALLTPNPDWVKAVMPNAKLPDRSDFKTYGERIGERQRDWRRAVAESQRLADEFAALVQQPSIDAWPLPA